LTGRGQANLLTRATAALAVGFFTTSLLLTIIGQRSAPAGSAFETPAPAASTAAPSGETKPAEPGAAPAGEAPRGGILDKLR
jgi:preprotein translocase subunit SecG